LPLLWSSAAGGAPGRMFLDVSLDWLVIGFAGYSIFHNAVLKNAPASCARALCFGLIPALRSSRIDLVLVMKEDLATNQAVCI
jgi:hypothetical protein